MKAKKYTYRAIELQQSMNPDFDLESWLADLLVDYWLSQRGNDGE